MTSPAAVDDPEARLRDWLASETFGSLRAVEVRVVRDIDSDDREAWFFEVVLPNPEPGEDTWPVEDLNKVALETRDKALEWGLAWPWYVRFRPESDDEVPEEPEIDDE